MRAPRASTLVLRITAFALLAAVAGPAAAAPAFDPAPAPQTGSAAPDGILLRADVAPNGTATWTVEYRIRLDDENATRAFEAFAADLDREPAPVRSRFERRMRATVSAAENATGREMAVANVTVSTDRRELPESYGVVSYRFEWAGFARIDGRRLVVGDALAGLFLDQNTRFVVSWPDGLVPRTVDPAPDERDSNSVTWVGPAEFAADQPRVALAAGRSLPPIEGPLLAVVIVVVGATLIGVSVYRWVRRSDEESEPAVDGAAPADTAGASEAGVEPEGMASAVDADGPDEDLLRPEERVLRLVRDRGGRVKQAEIGDTLDWSAARTGQVVGDLRDDGRIETFRVGRENVVSLPDADVVDGTERDDEPNGTS